MSAINYDAFSDCYEYALTLVGSECTGSGDLADRWDALSWALDEARWRWYAGKVQD